MWSGTGSSSGETSVATSSHKSSNDSVGGPSEALGETSAVVSAGLGAAASSMLCEAGGSVSIIKSAPGGSGGSSGPSRPSQPSRPSSSSKGSASEESKPTRRGPPATLGEAQPAGPEDTPTSETDSDCWAELPRARLESPGKCDHPLGPRASQRRFARSWSFFSRSARIEAREGAAVAAAAAGE
eukprot:6158146-Pyramimonas_sp.AAC.1